MAEADRKQEEFLRTYQKKMGKNILFVACIFIYIVFQTTAVYLPFCAYIKNKQLKTTLLQTSG